MTPTQIRLRFLFTYNTRTGILVRVVKTANKTKLGPVGYRTCPEGGLYTVVDGRRYAVSDIIWCYVTGQWPTCTVDHKDTIPTNNKWRNLRLATQRQNSYNRGKNKNNTTGYKGVTYQAGKHIAQIIIDGKYSYLGRHTTARKAHLVYVRAAKRGHKEFARAR